MSFGYRRTFRPTRRTRINLSKSGASASVKVGPVSVNVNPARRRPARARVNLGRVLRGLYWRS
jgi:Protein of unknown function (DUF4236)